MATNHSQNHGVIYGVLTNRRNTMRNLIAVTVVIACLFITQSETQAQQCRNGRCSTSRYSTGNCVGGNCRLNWNQRTYNVAPNVQQSIEQSTIVKSTPSRTIARQSTTIQSVSNVPLSINISNVKQSAIKNDDIGLLNI